MYHNPNYNNNRTERQTIVINITNFTGNSSNVWSSKLYEPLIIDKLSDVFLESFITFNCSGSNSSSTCAFIFGINEFNIKTNTSSELNASNNLINPECFHTILIPNEQSTGDTDQSTIHKAKKLNYICSINPTRLSSLNGIIENLEGNSIWNAGNIRLIVELVIVARG